MPSAPPSPRYSATFKEGHLPHSPAKKLAVVACMDGRLMVDQIFGLKIGDAHVIRNAGGLVTDDALRSLVISYHLLGTREFLVIEPTGCGIPKDVQVYGLIYQIEDGRLRRVN